jgi:hypothetical protein
LSVDGQQSSRLALHDIALNVDCALAKQASKQLLRLVGTWHDLPAGYCMCSLFLFFSYNAQTMHVMTMLLLTDFQGHVVPAPSVGSRALLGLSFGAISLLQSNWQGCSSWTFIRQHCIAAGDMHPFFCGCSLQWALLQRL